MTKQDIMDFVETRYANGFGDRNTKRLSEMLDGWRNDIRECAQVEFSQAEKIRTLEEQNETLRQELFRGGHTT